MEISTRNGQVFLWYEEDGSEWMFSGFLMRSGLHHMRLYPIEHGANWPVGDSIPNDVYLPDDDYSEMLAALGDLIGDRVWCRPDPLQRRMDAFLA